MKFLKRIFNKRNNTPNTDLHSIVSEWILSIEAENNLPDDTEGLYFGIFEEGTTGNYMLYLVGSNNYDKDDNDWACMSNQTFIPENMYCPILPISPSDDWETDLNIIIDCLKTIIGETPALRLWQVPVITAGFDEGELEIIHTSRSGTQDI